LALNRQDKAGAWKTERFDSLVICIWKARGESPWLEVKVLWHDGKIEKGEIN
jgi:hypothetical protein